jgi:hypothetical protein
MGPYAGVNYNLKSCHSRVDSNTFTMGIGQPSFDLNPKAESTFSLSHAGILDLASVA